MAIALGTGFSIGSKDLIYDKFVLTKEEMLNINENTYPDQFFALCSDNDCMYTFNISNPVNAETGKFREIVGSGTGGDVDLTTLQEQVNEIETNLHTHDNKEVLDLLSESAEGKLQYNGVTIGGEGGASSADAVSYSNDAISVTNVEEALNKLISDYYYVAPSVTAFTANPSGGTFEVGTTITAPTFNWSYNKDVTIQTLTDCTLADETVRTASYDTDITTDKTFTLTASDGQNNVSKSISYKFVYPYYVGVLNTNTPTETDIIGLTKKVEAKGNKTLEFTTSQSYMAFAYPSSYGDISKIVDQNGFDVTASFTKSTVVINSVDYYVYISNKNSGSYSMTVNY